ncbi:hypothetical protein E2562_008643 [Oryza meyeriana var. granulata]|uniref:Uncharacterized protein n=1 Tax=Oryza meyeriana var. granulata TaxID=110450 RepID=A0A6G1F5B3_9ORYZ|nr:hypothetical protein E2562_008643 [Oryza meyeriana var. granulata]
MTGPTRGLASKPHTPTRPHHHYRLLTPKAKASQDQEAKGTDRGAAMADAPSSPLLPRKSSSSSSQKQYARCVSHARDELHSFRTCLAWMCVDCSTRARRAASWAVFLLLAVAAPSAVSLALPDYAPPRPFDGQVQVSLTLAAALAYLSLTALLDGRGLRRLLYLDRLRHDSEEVRAGYMEELAGSFRVLACFLAPCALAEAAYKAYWYWVAPPFRSPWWCAAACALEVASWVYRTAVFFMVCVLFRTICYLQILRMKGFAREFCRFADVAAVLERHRRIRKQLHRISHRYRRFILCCLVLVTASQFAALLATTRPHAQINLATAGELALCSISLVAGLLVCLQSAAKITHKTQAITSVAAGWHADATINAFDNDQENPNPDLPAIVGYMAPANAYWMASGESSDYESSSSSSDDDSSGDSKYIPFQNNNSCFQKRQALVTYLENNRAGITVYGFVVDRTWLHALFMIEFSLVMWLLGKTVGIS